MKKEESVKKSLEMDIILQVSFSQTISHTIGNLSSTEELFSSNSDSSEEENIEDKVQEIYV